MVTIFCGISRIGTALKSSLIKVMALRYNLSFKAYDLGLFISLTISSSFIGIKFINPQLAFAVRIRFTFSSNSNSLISPDKIAVLILLMASGSFSLNNKTSFPALNAFNSNSPAVKFLVTPFISKASVMTRPS